MGILQGSTNRKETYGYWSNFNTIGEIFSYKDFRLNLGDGSMLCPKL